MQLPKRDPLIDTGFTGITAIGRLSVLVSKFAFSSKLILCVAVQVVRATLPFFAQVLGTKDNI
jgi:hypothetical protein